MRIAVFLLLLLCITATASAQRPGNKGAAMPDSLVVIKNRVKTVHVFFIERDGQRYHYKARTYDSLGRTIREEDAMRYSHEWTYNSKGRRISATQRDANGNFVQRYEYIYNADSSLTTAIFLTEDSMHPLRRYTVNSKNLCTSDTHYAQAGKVYSIRTMKYDSKGNLVAHYDSSGSARMAEWTANGLKVARKFYDHSGHLLHCYRFYYNRNNSIERITDSTGVMQTVEYTFRYNKGEIVQFRRNKKPMSESEITWIQREFWFVFPRDKHNLSDIGVPDRYGYAPEPEEEHHLSYDANGNIIRDDLKLITGSFSETRVFEYEYEFY